MESKRLKILKRSLIKKNEKLKTKLDEHFADVKSTNGQPLNDKRNGQSTFNRWDKQNNSIRNLMESIEKTKKAIEIEEGKIYDCEETLEYLPTIILNKISDGTLKQWRKHPNYFFVEGVEKARIIWDDKKKKVFHKYSKQINDKEQFKLFAKVYNDLFNAFNN